MFRHHSSETVTMDWQLFGTEYGFSRKNASVESVKRTRIARIFTEKSIRVYP